MKTLLSFVLAAIYVQCVAQTSFEFRNIDMVPANHSRPRYITSVGNKLYMRAESSAGDAQPWVSDGTAAGSMLLKNIYAVSGSYPSDFIALNGKVIFEARDSSKSYYPWVTDGTTAGTKRLASTPNPDFFTLYNNKVYYAAESAYGIEMFVTDGTDTGTHLFKDIYPGGKSSAPWPYTTYNGKLYFGAYDDNGKELWVTDGTDTGTHMVKDIYAGGAGSFPNSFAVLNGYLLFFASDSAHDSELWRTDGTAAGTQLVKDIWPGTKKSVNYTYPSVVLNGYLYFTANDSVHGYELWRTDGTEVGTQMIKDINTGTNNSIPLTVFKPVAYKGKIYFAATDDTTGVELWSTDGTAAGTQLVADIFIGQYNSEPRFLTVFKNTLLFAANIANTDAELFTSDGTTAGTTKIYPKGGKLTDPVSYSWFYGFTYHAADTSLYFAASYDDAGVELWSLKERITTNIENTSVNNHQFNIYPNPSDGNFTIEINTGFKEGNVVVYDMMGRLIKSEKMVSKSKTISINQPKGIYLVKLQLDSVVMTKRIVLE